MKQGCKVEGVPGFYLDDSGRWTMNFYRKNAGILIPAVGYDGMIHGLQILLDSPLKQKDDSNILYIDFRFSLNFLSSLQKFFLPRLFIGCIGSFGNTG